jgi:ArsR family transcriptional regulator
MGKTKLTKPVSIDESQAVAAAEVLKAIAHPLRLRVLCLLSRQEENVKAIASELDVPSAIASQQLRILRSAGLVASSTRDGHAYYRIIEPHLFRMLGCVESCITDRGV